MFHLLRFLAAALCGCLSATAADVVMRSGPARVTLIELYTSEGCSSCPPAEKWLAELRQDERLWREFVPVAFHVNYWDHLGWRDALATPQFTEREHAYARRWNANSVYTPCFVRDGVEWRPADHAVTIGDRANAGIVTLRWRPDSRNVEIEYAAAAALPASIEATVAWLGGRIVTDVRKGENAGRTLSHDFVALQLQTKELRRSEDGVWRTGVTLRSSAAPAASRHAVAAWITRRGELAPLQAVGGWLD